MERTLLGFLPGITARPSYCFSYTERREPEGATLVMGPNPPAQRSALCRWQALYLADGVEAPDIESLSQSSAFYLIKRQNR